jgi:hypothetical protein
MVIRDSEYDTGSLSGSDQPLGQSVTSLGSVTLVVRLSGLAVLLCLEFLVLSIPVDQTLLAQHGVWYLCFILATSGAPRSRLHP